MRQEVPTFGNRNSPGSFRTTDPPQLFLEDEEYQTLRLSLMAGKGPVVTATVDRRALLRAIEALP